MPPTVFAGGEAGPWNVLSIAPVKGPTLPMVPRLEVFEDAADAAALPTAWRLRGRTSNSRYTRRDEQLTLSARQPALGRPDATRAALIPITKSPAWWALAQDERRELLEETSHHIAIGLQYLPAVARRLHHGRDLGEAFDFLTWFEYMPHDAGAFEELVSRLRATPEWDYVEHEVDIRLAR
ncbi:MAG: chlorite dismutase family protein [Actinobacteria bacterium]|nr:chlorite dismutase family protein [Actinomycetota bacterium]MCA1720149.1 chlorite dismutase family protein [Actinomycetota bacterium]